jgi:hypothetical protein
VREIQLLNTSILDGTVGLSRLATTEGNVIAALQRRIFLTS